MIDHWKCSIFCHESRITCFIQYIQYFLMIHCWHYSAMFNESKETFKIVFLLLFSYKNIFTSSLCLFVLINLCQWIYNNFDDTSNLIISCCIVQVFYYIIMFSWYFKVFHILFVCFSWVDHKIVYFQLKSLISTNAM